MHRFSRADIQCPSALQQWRHALVLSAWPVVNCNGAIELCVDRIDAVIAFISFVEFSSASKITSDGIKHYQ